MLLFERALEQHPKHQQLNQQQSLSLPVVVQAGSRTGCIVGSSGVGAGVGCGMSSRSISPVPRSVRRIKSLLNVTQHSAPHSPTTTSTTIACSDDSLTLSPILIASFQRAPTVSAKVLQQPLKSILKRKKTDTTTPTSSPTSSPVTTTATRTITVSKSVRSKERVRFKAMMSLVTVHKIESVLPYALELWWSTEELKQYEKTERLLLKQFMNTTNSITQNDKKDKVKNDDDKTSTNGKNNNTSDTDPAKEYIQVLYHSRKQIQERQKAAEIEATTAAARSPTNSTATTTATTTATSTATSTTTKTSDRSKKVLSTKYFQQLVIGRSYGYAGLERHASSLFDEIRKEERTIVKSIVRKYRKLKTLEKEHQQKHQQHQLHNRTNNNEKNALLLIDEKLGSYSRSLSSADRSLAFILGHADREAAMK